MIGMLWNEADLNLAASGICSAFNKRMAQFFFFLSWLFSCKAMNNLKRNIGKVR